MKDVCIIATRHSLAHQAQAVTAAEGHERVEVVLCRTVEEISGLVASGLERKVEVVITLPGPARLVRELLGEKMPVIILEYGGVEIVKRLIQAFDDGHEAVAMGEYITGNSYMEDIRAIVGRPFKNFLFANDDSINATIIANLKRRGISAIVGGGYICNLAQDLGCSVYPLEIGGPMLRKALNDAISIAASRRYERHSRKNIETILENQSEPVVGVDVDNRMTFINKAAASLFETSSPAALGRKSTDIVPENMFGEILESGRPASNVMHGWKGAGIMADYRPVFDDTRIIGVIATFATVSDIHERAVAVRRHYASRPAKPDRTFEIFAPNGEAFHTVVAKARCYAMTDETVLITGESGTGKEVMAESIHNASRRKASPFLAINCASIPSALMESELFGYEAGAFTGGKKTGAQGMFEAAHGGSVFLDEIGEMPLELQAKLLRVIQEKKVRRVGAAWEVPVDVRIIAATNRILEHEVAARRFRHDLYYRLNVLHVHLPALREYASCIPAIADRMLLALWPGVSMRARKHLSGLLDSEKRRNWPGNMRELENVVRRYVALQPQMPHELQPCDIFAEDAFSPLPGNDVHANPQRETAREREIRELGAVYQKCRGNRNLMASELGISRTTLWRKLKKAGLA